MPPAAEVERGAARLDAVGDRRRAMVPVLFRGQPEGAIVLIDAQLPPHVVEFTIRAAGQLGIAISNVRAYSALEHLAKELTERNAALVKQRDQLQEMNRLKSEFLANISHELRTPLNAILGYTELIAEEVYGPVTGEQRDGLTGIDESSRNLLTLINQILDLSKVESGKMDMYITEVAMHDVAQAVASETRVLAKERPYKVAVHAPARVVIKTDHAKVHQVLTNLVANAIKFTEKGSVTVSVVGAPDGGCDITVKDTGIGIRKADQTLIFEEFRQVDGSSTRKFGGTGLGLAIARRFAVLLSGSIAVESEPGKGSIFTLHLPAEPRPLVRPPPVPTRASSPKIEAVRPNPGRRP
jgi:signal transduction histidine kinase